MVKLHWEWLPEASVAVQLTVLVPIGKHEPEAGVAITETPGQLSVAVTEKFTVAQGASTLTRIGAGQMI